jgi:hypothetical protein
MRVFARWERPHPGAQLTLVEAHDGWRYSLWVTNLPASLRGWRANPAYIDAAHRVYARVEDGIRTGKDCGIGHFPSHDFAINSAWLAAALVAATLLAWLRLLALDGDLARAEPKTLRYKILHTAARLARGGRRRRLKISRTWPWATAIATAWARLRPAAGSVTSATTSPRSRKEHHAGARGTPRPPGPPAGSLSYPDPKIKILNEAQRPFQTSHRST